MNRTIRYAVVGAGHAGRVHARLVNQLPEFDLAAIVDVNRNAAEELASRYGARPVTDLDNLDGDGIDAVSVAVPPALHLDIGSACLSRGWHVMMEKPLELSAERARRLVDAAAKAGRILAVCHQYRRHIWTKKVKTIIESGEIGDPLHMVWTLSDFRSDEYFEYKPWKAETDFAIAGILTNQAAHAVDNLIWLLGRPVKVTGLLGQQLHRKGGADLVAAQIRFESGCIASLSWSINMPKDCSFRQFVGTKGIIRIPNTRSVTADVDDALQIGYFDGDLEQLVDTAEAQPAVTWTPKPEQSGLSTRYRRKAARKIRRMLGRTPQPPDPNAAHAELLQAFALAINGQGSPIVTGEDGLLVVAVLEAIERSARNGSSIESP